MKSKSTAFRQFVIDLDDVLSKMHSKTISGNPINPADDEWINTRDRLVKVKIPTDRSQSYPINFQLAEQLMMDELCSREDVHPEHIELRKERN